MASRVQQLILGLGKAKQTNISTIAASFLRWKKLDTSITSPHPMFETDAAEIGKGNEFTSQGGTFPSHYEVANRIEKYASCEFATWAWGYCLGNVAEVGSSAPYTYTILPIDPGTTLELPYFSVVEQIAEGGGSSIDNAYRGCAIEDLTYTFNYGPGRASSKLLVNWVGSGLLTTPSGVTVPGVTTETSMLAAGMTLTVNGVNYLTNGRILSGSAGWKNNLLLNTGFHPGSGLQNGLQVRDRLEIGVRVPTFQFTLRLLASSTEYATLLAQTAGTATLVVSADANHSMALTWTQMAFSAVDNGDVDGLVSITVTGAPQYDAGLSTVLTVTTKCPITGIVV